MYDPIFPSDMCDPVSVLPQFSEGKKGNKENLRKNHFQTGVSTMNIDHSHPGVHKIFLKISLNLLLLNKTAENLYPIYLWNNLTIMLKDLTWNNLIRVQSDHESFF